MQFDLYKNPNEQTRNTFPYLLDIQSNILEKLATRIVVPLSLLTQIKKPLDILNPVIEFEEEKFVALFDELSSYPQNMLKDKVSNLSEFREEFIKANVFLIQGY